MNNITVTINLDELWADEENVSSVIKYEIRQVVREEIRKRINSEKIIRRILDAEISKVVHEAIQLGNVRITT